MRMYNVIFRLGQTLVNAKSAGAAKAYAQYEWGRMNGPYKVNEATKDDEAWVKAMGGIVHNAH